MIWQTYLWAAVLASTTPAVCIHDRTGFMPLPSGSSFIVVPPLGIFSWIPNIKAACAKTSSSRWGQSENRGGKRKRRFSTSLSHSDLCESLVVIEEKKTKQNRKQAQFTTSLGSFSASCVGTTWASGGFSVRISQRLVWIRIPLEKSSKYLDDVFFFSFLKKISSTCLVTLRCDDALRLVSSSLQEKKSFRTLLNRPLSGKPLQLQKTNKREKNYDLARRCSRTRERAWWGGPLASLGMDGSVQNSALYPLGLKPFPGAKTLDPRDPHCQSDDALWAGFWPYMEEKGSDISGRWRCPSCAWVSTHIHTLQADSKMHFLFTFSRY